jgi:hypothetical protein
MRHHTECGLDFERRIHDLSLSDTDRVAAAAPVPYTGFVGLPRRRIVPDPTGRVRSTRRVMLPTRR